MDEPEDQDLPCLSRFPTKSPIVVVTNAPTYAPSIAATNAPSNLATNSPSTITDPIQTSLPTGLPQTLLPTVPPTFKQTIAPTATEIIDRFQCPGEDCTFDFESDENSSIVQYHYTVETSASVTDPSEYLSALEQRLLEKVANVVLAHCLEGEDIRRSLTRSQTTTFQRRRSLHTPRRLAAAVGVCSLPDDEYLSQETCIPEENPSNNCFVIKGYMSVAVEEGESSTAITEEMLGIIEGAMANDELLSEDTPEIEKITFIGDLPDGGDDDGTVVVPINTGDLNKDKNDIDGIIIGSSLAALALLLFAIFYRRRRKDSDEVDLEVSETPFGIEIFAGKTNGSFVGPDSFDLGKETSAMDVHHCTSQTCTKCYRNPRVQFVTAPINANGQYARDHRHLVATNTFSADSDASSVNTDEFF